jgi:hypothetical protein
MLEVGMKVLIIGAHTDIGRRNIGKMAVIHQLPEVLDIFDPDAIKLPDHLSHLSGSLRLPCLLENCALLQGDIEAASGSWKPGFALFDRKHLMPLPPLKDTGIDDHTFTPIQNQEPVGA